ncbi:MAG: hypothetical protein ACRBK7_03815 [Acidimicrobiales bacterium]
MSLPLVVAGPVLRRVEPNLVTVWVALSRPGDVHIFVHLGLQDAANIQGEVVFSSMAATRAIGQNLHVATVSATPDTSPVDPLDPTNALAPNTTYSYNLVVSEPDGSLHSLESMDLLVDEVDLANRLDGVAPEAPMNLALGYADGQLPSFRTCPVDLEDLVLVQAGCRNTGSSEQDAAGWIDKVIGDNIADDGRPHQLLMTGDQIYADSANTLILPMMNEIGAELLGHTETLMVVDTEVPVTLGNFPAYRRGWLCKDRAGFTTGSANHVLSFGEFAGAYCLAWNPSIWRKLPELDEIFTENDGSPDSAIEADLTPWDEFKRKKKGSDELISDEEWVARKQKRYDGWKAGLEMYRATIPQIRRAMANCPTYMIFDDHEVTDDWNMSRQWTHRVYSTPLGRRVLRNALSAYAYFQAWGNDPVAWSGGSKKVLLDKIVEAWEEPGVDEYPEALAAQDIDVALGLPTKFPTGIEPVTWHYSVEAPAHRLVVIDTRTKRTYATHVGPARLLGTSLNTMVPSKPEGDERLLILMAAQPPLMPALFDQIAQPLGTAVVDMLNQAQIEAGRREGEVVAAHELESGGEKLEAESWGLEEFGLEQLLARLAGYKRVVILSGDVHFSCALSLDYWKKGSATPARYVQLIMSPSRHQWPDMVHDLMRTTSLSERFAQLGHPAERLGWSSSDKTPLAPQAPPGIAARAARSPALLPAKGWPEGTTLRDDPDWTWRMDLVADTRLESERPPSIRLPALPVTDLDEPNPADPISSYYALAATHQQQTTRQFSHLRRLVFPTAIGIVTFPKPDPDGEHQVRHDIWTANPDDPSEVNLVVGTGEPNTVHVIDLAPTTDPQPGLQIGSPGVH